MIKVALEEICEMNAMFRHASTSWSRIDQHVIKADGIGSKRHICSANFAPK